MSVSILTTIANCWPYLHAVSAADVVFTSDAELTRIIADRLKALAERFGIFVARDTTSITLVAGTALYQTPPDHLDTIHVAINGVPLIASSTRELEAGDDAFQTTQSSATNPIQFWYEDEVGANTIGFAPVPSALDVGKVIEVIFHTYQCDLDEAHTNVTIDAPLFVGDLLEFTAVAESYQAESDFQMPEVSQAALQLVAVYEQAIGGLWGPSQ